jgi:cytochrome b6-f complex iron-sulfur subunit
VSHEKRDRGIVDDSAPRRDFLKWVSTVTMGSGLLASYGTFAAMAVRYMYSAKEATVWQFVARTSDMALGEARHYVTPSGAKIVVARQTEGDSVANFVALSSTCPHLGCQVHWEPQNRRFFCPCHNGAFDANGKATEGPPAQANQQLVRYALDVRNGLLYVRIPAQALSVTPESRS